MHNSIVRKQEVWFPFTASLMSCIYQYGTIHYYKLEYQQY